jgi:hypothetical protein
VIPLTLQQEPADFHTNVRIPGETFLAQKPEPNGKEFKQAAFWKRAAKELHAAYSGVCAYTCFYMMPPGSIDHYLPKSSYPRYAYEWSNLRLASHRVNLYKKDSVDVLDPCAIAAGWFIMDVPSCLIRPADDLEEPARTQVQNTVDILQLNIDDVFVQERCDMMYAYASGEVSLDYLRRRYPLLAAEIIRQGLQETAKDIFKTPRA